MALTIENTPPYCQAVNCEKPTTALVSTLHKGWVALCTDHGVLQLAFMGDISARK